MTADTTTASTPRQVCDGSLLLAGGIFAIAAGLLRVPAAALGPDASGPGIDALYDAIDIGLLFTVIAVYWADPSTRTRIGTMGFVLGCIGAGLLIGPEPSDSSVDYYAIGATGVTLGLALLAIAWRHGTRFRARTRTLLLATIAIGAVAGASDIALLVAGVLFSLALIDIGAALVADRALRTAPAPTP